MAEKENKEIVIDGKECIAGRIAAFAAKKLLQGERVIILNCKDIIIIGNKKNILQRYRNKFALGRDPQKGPHFERLSDKLMRRIVRGMLPWKKTTGREAFRRVLCFKDVPEKYKSMKKIVVAKADAINFITLHEICKLIGKEK